MKTDRKMTGVVVRVWGCTTVVALLGVSVCAAAPRPGGSGRSAKMPTQTIVMDGAGNGPVFDGIGAVSAGASSRLLVDYPEPERGQILDYLFKPNYGAALQHLKVEIGADVDSTDGAEPSFMRTPTDKNFHRGYEWWLMAEAHERNPEIVLDTLPWGAPGWIGNGRFYSKDMAKYVAAFVEGAKKAYGLDVAYTGVWNEKRYNAEYVKELYAALRADDLPTKIVCCDQYPGRGGSQWQIVKAMGEDPALKRAVAVVSVHYPWVYNHTTTPEDALTIGKPLWSSEDQPNAGGGPFVSRDWEYGGRYLARLYNLNYLQGGLTATEIWSPITSYYDILAAPGSGLMIANTPWSGHYKVQAAIWVTAHTTQFTKPGWRFDNLSCGYLANGGSFVTYLSPDRKQWSTVMESIVARQAQTVRIVFAEGLAPRSVHVWETNDKKTFEHVADLKPVKGAIVLRVDPDSLYTLTNTTGQGKGMAVPPAAKSFPLPYADDFDSTKVGNSPKYLTDQDGAFEAHVCRGRAGKCLEQVITMKPIPWGPLPDPFTIAGDENWANYSVSADVEIPNTGVGTVFGRIDSANVFRDGRKLYPSGYGLLLESNGDWQLISTSYTRSRLVLAKGEIPAGTPAWHHVALRFAGTTIEAMIDGREVARTADSSHTNGMFALGSNWTRVEFDDLRVEPVSVTPDL